MRQEQLKYIHIPIRNIALAFGITLVTAGSMLGSSLAVPISAGAELECGQESSAMPTGLIRMHIGSPTYPQVILVGGRGAMSQGSIRLHLSKEKQMLNIHPQIQEQGKEARKQGKSLADNPFRLGGG